MTDDQNETADPVQTESAAHDQASHELEHDQGSADEHDGNYDDEKVFDVVEVEALGERFVRRRFQISPDDDVTDDARGDLDDFVECVGRFSRHIVERTRASERTRTRRWREDHGMTRGSTIAPLASEVVERRPVATYTTGFADLDRHLGGGITTRSVTGIVSRTGAGKSGNAITIGMHIQRTYNVPILYISTELDADECRARFAAHVLKIGHGEILKGNVPRSQADAALKGLPIHIVDCEKIEPGRDALDKIADAIATVTEMYGEPPIVIVDYLQELVDTDPRNGGRLGFTDVARSMRKMAQAHEVALIAVSSVSRGFYKTQKEGADDPLTYLSAAKESGDIEYAVANLLYLDVAPEHVAGVYPARIVVAKARRGSLGFVGARFHGPSGRWEPHAPNVAEMSQDRRRTRAKDDEKSRDESAMLAAITDASKRGDKRTKNTWRECGVVPKERASAAINRLLAGGRLVSVPGYCERSNRMVDFVVPEVAHLGGAPKVGR